MPKAIGANNNLIQAYGNINTLESFRLDAEINGEEYLTLTRDKFNDMFKILRDKRVPISTWSKITGMVCR